MTISRSQYATPGLLLLALVLLMLVSSIISGAQAAQTKIYKTVDEDGNVVFTDMPPKSDQDAEQVIVQTPNSFASEEASGPREEWIVEEGAEGEELAEELFRYSSVQIVSPANDETVRANDGSVSVVAASRPRMKRGHVMRILIDGSPVQEGSQTTFNLENVDRGTHSVSAEIVDGSGNVLSSSNASVFHLQRVAVGGPRPGPA